ncbi:Alpha/beta hydrolase fold-1 [Diplogelasinospora grovesii]|uniref:Alpha/beta hydrolase fold-1 n=1 Tax=Diplogelasinospora grovesii TaxID=303347 RepID=A0AAN6N3Z1_9PEZI|nr:Alpha/beta hydrolase fold-1 [Diplogelasinospora grovesii]
MSGKPVIVLVHGAWHRPLHYNNLISPLKDAGFTVVAPANASAGYDDSVAGKTHLDDVAVVHAAMKPHLDAGKEIVVVCHSYGGLVGTDSTAGNTLEERKAQGLKGGVRSIIYIAAFALPQSGVSLAGLGSGIPKPDWWALERKQGDYALLSEKAPATLYSDVDETNSAMAASCLARQSIASMSSNAKHSAGELKAAKTYIVCKKDLCLPGEFQTMFAQAMQGTIIELDCGHSPFFKKPETQEILQIIKTAAE